jgi:hypothetical protein
MGRPPADDDSGVLLESLGSSGSSGSSGSDKFEDVSQQEEEEQDSEEELVTNDIRVNGKNYYHLEINNQVHIKDPDGDIGQHVGDWVNGDVKWLVTIDNHPGGRDGRTKERTAPEDL